MLFFVSNTYFLVLFSVVKAKKEVTEATAAEALDKVVSIVENEEKRLGEIRQELSELNIVIGK
jgi:hypothetical protein